MYDAPLSVLLTGTTGYIGGRLLPRLEAEGHLVRCLVRTPGLFRHTLGPLSEVASGDVLDRESLVRALRGIDVAYYLVHSMSSGADFEGRDRLAAENFGSAAREAGVARIVYLGGLGDETETLSPHLRSRHEVGRVLARSGIPVLELRASIVIGSGSLSFELIRALVERLPIMITPRWVSVNAQPVAVNDLLAYLVASLRLRPEGHQVIEIGGADRVSYGDVMEEYARQRGLRRLMISVPVLTPRLSSLWLGLVTPVYAHIGRTLVDSMRHPTVVREDSASRIFEIRPKGVREAIADALRNEDHDFAETRWSDARSAAGIRREWGGTRFGNRLIDRRSIIVPTGVESAFTPIQRVGGTTGWYYADWLWRLRGFLDLLVGGVGMRRGRRHPTEIRPGDTVDWWRVEAIEPHHRLRLAAEMHMPGRAWLEFEVTPVDRGTQITQTAVFDPVGLAGLCYWYAVYPLHSLVFAGMIRGIARRAGIRPDSR